MSALDIDAIEALLTKATPGPWELRRDDDGDGYITHDIGVGGLTIARVPEDTRDDDEVMRALADARLIIALVEQAPGLLAIARAVKALGEARAAWNHAISSGLSRSQVEASRVMRDAEREVERLADTLTTPSAQGSE